MAVSISTAQNVQLHLTTANLGKRLLAAFLDSLVLTLISWVFWIIGLTAIAVTSEMMGFAAFLLVNQLVGFLYHFVFEVFTEGKSPGKSVMKIQVVRQDGNRAGISNYFLRALLKPIDSASYLGIAVMFLSDKSQRIGDMLAGTIVIDTASKISSNEIMVKSVPDDYIIRFPQVALLSEKKARVIKAVLETRSKDRTHATVKGIAEKVLENFGITHEEIADLHGSYDFLKRVYRDYEVYFIRLEEKDLT